MNSDIGDITTADQGHPDKQAFILNGNIMPHYYINSPYYRFLVIFSPVVRIRMFANQFSEPIRTPSFMPGMDVYFRTSRSGFQHYKYWSAGIYHHSNGQDGPALNKDGSINTYNGNFTTYFVTANYHFGSHNENWNWHVRLGPEFHSGLVKMLDEPLLRDKFSKIRFNYQGQISNYINRILQNGTISNEEERYRVVLEGMFVLDNLFKGMKIDINAKQYLNAELKFYKKIPGSENTAFFLSLGYMGYDYYNIYFDKPYSFARIGLAASNAFMYNSKFIRQKRILNNLNAPAR